MSGDEAGTMVIRTCDAFDGVVEAPPSKSLTIRGLAAAALADGTSALRNPLFSDDTLLMAESLDRLGIPIVRKGPSFVVEGRGGLIPAREASLELDNAGTPLRLLTALCALGKGRFMLDGSSRMRERPVAPLIEALESLGVLITSVNGDGCPPVEIVADGFPGGKVTVNAGVSSQFLSALLMAGPCGSSNLEIEVPGRVVSRPYVDLTLQVMRSFGARVEHTDPSRYVVTTGGYAPRVFPVEGDASSASYFFAAAAVTNGSARVTGIPPDSQQGDLKFLRHLSAMGCRYDHSSEGIVGGGGPLTGIDADLSDTPDLAPSLAVTALFAEGPTTIRGVEHLRVKETDRIATIAAGIRALGGAADEHVDGLTITPPHNGRSGLTGGRIDPAGDHRIAMAFTIAGLAVPGVEILDPACVSKSFPDFYTRLETLIGQPPA